MIAVLASQRQLDAEGNPVLARVPIEANGSSRPVPTTSIHVRVNRWLDPASVNRQAICIQSSTAVITRLDECTGGVTTRPTYDPVTRTAIFHLDAPLAPTTLYRITLLPAREGEDFGLRAYDGTPLPGIFALEVTTDVAGDDAPLEAPPAGPLFCGTPECLAPCNDAEATCAAACAESETCLASCAAQAVQCRQGCSVLSTALSSCGSAGCHASAAGAPPAAMGLDLSTADGVAATAVGKVAHQTQRGPKGASPDLSGIAFGRAMSIVQPGDPGRSYLLYKILGSRGLTYDGDLASGDKQRLREDLVVGMPMPPEPYEPPPDQQLDHLVRWIAAGADVGACP